MKKKDYIVKDENYSYITSEDFKKLDNSSKNNRSTAGSQLEVTSDSKRPKSSEEKKR